jgi:hypothetical protein
MDANSLHEKNQRFGKNESLSKSKKLIIAVFLALFLFETLGLFAQVKEFDKEDYKLKIPKIESSIEIDGILDEPAWELAKADTNFWNHHPVDIGRAFAKTEIKMMYDNEKLYIGFICYGAKSKPIVQSLARDDEDTFWAGDGVTVIIDPGNADKNGYYFSVNAEGAEIDGIVYQNGMDPLINNNWNNNWEAKVNLNRDILYYEIAIPFDAIKFSEERSDWGINFIRNDAQRNNNYSWTLFPSNKLVYDFGFNGNLFFKDGLPKGQSSSIVLMPFTTGGLYFDRDNNEDTKFKVKARFDAKISMGSALNLDISVYPDFSNVTVDQQYIDFYRFEYYQPEHRGFFLENNDLFSSFGTYEDATTSASDSRIKPIYTRRIGREDDENIPIIYGARLSGGLNEDLRIGLLNLQTESYKNQQAQNYVIGAFQQGIFKRSAIKGIFTNRQGFKDKGFLKNDFNRTGGLEFDYSTEDGMWTANVKYHNSFTPEKFSNTSFYGGGFTFNTKHFKTQNWVHRVGKNYISDIGFIPRLYHKDPILDTTYRYGYTHFMNTYEYYNFPNNNLMLISGEYIKFNTYLNENGGANEFKLDAGYWGVFANNTHIVLNLTYDKFDLLVPYDVFDNDNPVPTGTYENPSVCFLYESDPREKLKYDFSVEYGKFYNGKKFTFTGGPSYTIQPNGTISLMYSLADINLEKGYGQSTYHLVGGKSEISFTTNLFWTSLIQYNTQKKDINFNSIFQWRYAPMSDFFIVLKNDLSQSGVSKKLEISIKLTYWLGII